MAAPRKHYWDASVFLCFLNKKEIERRNNCEDILYHAKAGELIIYTSTYTIAEVIKPKEIKDAIRLTSTQISKIQQMFQWSWVRKIDLSQRVAFKAVELARDYGLSPADSVHVASALSIPVDVFQKFDRDFSRVANLLSIAEPARISAQGVLVEWKPALGPQPEEFEPPK